MMNHRIIEGAGDDDVTIDSHNFPASAPVDGTEYDPEGLGRSNTMGYPPRPLPYKTI